MKRITGKESDGMIIFAIIVMIVLAVRTFGFGMCAPGIIGMAACAASVLCMILARHSSRRIIFNIIAAITCAGACVCIILAGKGNGGSGSISNREKMLAQISQQDDIDEAVKRYERYVKKYGEDEQAKLSLAMEYINADMQDESRNILMNDIQNTSSKEYYLAMVEWNKRFNGYDLVGSVMDLMSQAVVDNPDWSWGYVILGTTYYEKGYPEYAKYYFTKAYKLDTTDGYAPCYLGVIAYDSGYYDNATQFLDKAWELSGDDAYLQSVITYYRQCVAREVA